MNPSARHRPARCARFVRRVAAVCLVLGWVVNLAGCGGDDRGPKGTPDGRARNASGGAASTAAGGDSGPGGDRVPPPAFDAAAGPLVAIIVDDWGQALNGPQVVILALPQPLTFAVLPCLPRSGEIAALATALDLPAGTGPGEDIATTSLVPPYPATARREIFLHLPMQPLDYPESDPGQPVLVPGMEAAEVERRLALALASVPGARGVNNHMGSAATADSTLMSVLMRGLARRHLRFVDSLTSPASVAFFEACRAGVPALRNRIFLDADRWSEEAITANLATLVAAARAQGGAVGIAHPYVATAEVLARELPRYEAEGVRFVTVSELMAHQKATAAGAKEVANGR